jgi:hypothetical protein
MGPNLKGGNNVARKSKLEKKQRGWCSDDEMGDGMAKQRDKT